MFGLFAGCDGLSGVEVIITYVITWICVYSLGGRRFALAVLEGCRLFVAVVPAAFADGGVGVLVGLLEDAESPHDVDVDGNKCDVLAKDQLY